MSRDESGNTRREQEVSKRLWEIGGLRGCVKEAVEQEVSKRLWEMAIRGENRRCQRGCGKWEGGGELHSPDSSPLSPRNSKQVNRKPRLTKSCLDVS